MWNLEQNTLEINVVPKQLAPTKRGINGPNFLSQGEDCWPNQTFSQQPTDNDPDQVKSEAGLGLSSEVNQEFLDPKKTSSWTHLVRITAWVFRFTQAVVTRMNVWKRLKVLYLWKNSRVQKNSG